MRSWLSLARVQIDQGLQASDVAAAEEGELYALMHNPETVCDDAMEPIFAVRSATEYWLMCAADGSAAPDVGGIVGGEHLDRDAAGHSDDDLKNELSTFYFVPEDEDLAAAAGLLSEGEEEAGASEPAPAAGAPAEPAPGAAEPAGQRAATNPMEVPGAAAGALGGEEEEEIAAGALGAEEEDAEDAEDAEAEEEVEEEAEEEEDVPDVEETLNMSDAALASTRLGLTRAHKHLGRAHDDVGHHPHASHQHEHPGQPAAHRGRRWLVPAVLQDRPGHAGPRARGSRPR